MNFPFAVMQDVDKEIMVLIQYPLFYCIGSGWDGIHFPTVLTVLCSALVAREVLWHTRVLSAGNSAHTASRPLLQHSLLNQQAVCEQDFGRKHSQHTWPKWTEGMFQSTWCQFIYENEGKGRRGRGIIYYGQYLSSRATTAHIETLFLTKGLDMAWW